MSDLGAFIQLGFGHIVSVEAMDHILFLLALSAIYRPRDWRDALWVVTSFTVGHSITLALAVTGIVTLPTALIEFLIPVTIVATCAENLIVRDRERTPLTWRYRPVLAAVFGLVHGAGFANYLRSLFMDDIALPLFGFNVGIEAGQLVVLIAAGLLLMIVDRGFGAARRRLATHTPRFSGWTPLRMRAVSVSVAVGVIAARWAVERFP